MSKTDFFDDDLVKRREEPKRVRLGHGDTGGVASEPSPSDDAPSRPVSDFNLTRMAKHKEEVSVQMAQAVEELERLRARQEDLEREKRSLEDLRRKQHDYEMGKREILGHLGQSIVSLEKDELQAARLVETLGSTREQFRQLKQELESLREEQWAEANVQDELNRSLAVIDRVRVEYNKALAKIEAVSADGRKPSGEHQPIIFEERGGPIETEKPFGYWLKVGFAATLPLLVVLAVITLVFFLLQTGHI